MREHGGEGGFAHPALAAEDEDLVFDAREAGGDQRNVGVRAFGGGGADELVGAASAGVAFAGEVGFGAGAVLCGLLARMSMRLLWRRGCTRFRRNKLGSYFEGGKEVDLDGFLEGRRHEGSGSQSVPVF